MGQGVDIAYDRVAHETPYPEASVLAVSVAMPASKEEAVVRDVVEAWDRQLDALGIPHELRVYYKGARDAIWASAIRRSRRSTGPAT